jgi:hypothetical protein
MNLTSTNNIPSNNWRNFKGVAVAAVAGLAIAVGTVWSPSTDAKLPAPSETTAPAARTFSRHVPDGRHTIYIVAGEAERTSLLNVINGETAVLDYVSDRADTFDVLIAGNPYIQDVLTEMSGSTQVVDLTYTMQSYSIETPRRVSDAEIAASVLSTELATYGSGATQDETYAAFLASERAAQDAAIMAGVISSERATFGDAQ